jgi:cytochrome P450
MITMSDPVEHARVRKIFTPAFSDRALVQQSPLFTMYADQLISNMKEGAQTDATFDLVRMYSRTPRDCCALRPRD